MLLRPFLNDASSCASYLFGCGTHAKLAVVDPHADLVDDYLAGAAALGAPVVAVFETHVQADHVSGLPALVERTIVDFTFTASPSAMRKVLNQIASSDRQFFIVRTLYVRNEQLKGPSREQSNAAPAATTPPAPTSGLKFVVGNEHVETTATIEMVRFAF